MLFRSLNRIAASKPKRRIGCNVTSAASSGWVQSAMKSPAFARTARYSGKYRPAWRIIQTGNTLLGHVVGAGKTFTMIAAGMEQRAAGYA